MSWNEVLELESPNEAFDKFFEIFTQFYNINFPLVSNRKNNSFIPRQPFMTHGLLKCRKKKEDLARIAKANPHPPHIDIYKNYRNIYGKLIRTAKKLHYRHLIAEAGNNSKKIWKVLKDSLNLKQKNSSVSKIIFDNITLTDNLKIADAFNHSFSNIGPSLANSIPVTNKHYSDFLPPPANASFFMHPINELTMFNYILSTKPKLSLDDNDLNMRLLHDVATPITKPLCHIFNQSISLGVFPDNLKTSRCIPIFKSGSPFSLDNYRGVANINCFSKIFEKIFSERLTKFLEDNNFFSDAQFGFRKGISTSHALACIMNKITKHLNEDKFVMALLCDVKKCFDSVPREILFKKLENAGVRGLALSWIKSYFYNRTQRVFVNGVNSSSKCDLPYGVLQGSILGVIFFLIFINDLPRACQILLSYLFADDNTCLIAASTLHELLSIANVEVDLLLQWYNSNCLVIHPAKTKCFIFRPPRTALALNTDIHNRLYLPIFLNMNNPLENNISKIIPINIITEKDPEETSSRLLGVLIDEKLNFKDHFKYLHGKIARAVFSLRIMKHILDKRHLKLLYNSYLKSSLEYGCILFTTATKTTIKPISILQKKAIRLICNVGYREHTAILFKNEKILRFEDIISYNICRFMFDYKSNNLPKIFDATWQLNSDIHDHEVRNAHDFFINIVNKPYLNKFPLFQFPKVWNSLPVDLKQIISRREFAKKLHIHFIDNIEID